MNWVDIAIIFVIAVTSLYSFMWGFIRQLLLIVCFGVGLYVALTYHGLVYEQFTKNWVQSETIAQVIAGGLLFVGTFVVVSILTIPLFKLVRSRAIRFLDHLTGLFFGFVLGGAIASIAWIATALTWQPAVDDANIKNSRLLPYVHVASLSILGVAERAPFTQDDDIQLLILDAWQALREADPRPKQRNGVDLQANGGLRSVGGDDAIGTLISSTGNE
jgi:membrane protein required for colicin V production